MVQVLKNNRGPSFGEQFSSTINSIVPTIQQHMKQGDQRQAIEKMGLDPSVLQLPEQAQAEYFKNAFNQSGANKSKEMADKLASDRRQLYGVGKSRGMQGDKLEEFVDTYQGNVNLGEKVTKPIKENKPALTEKEVPTNISRNIKKILADNPKSTSDELRIAMDEAGIPPVYSNPYTENRRRTEETLGKQEQEKTKELRHETLPVRQEIAKRASSAEKGIQNKEELLQIIEKGNIDDPTFAALAEALPMKLGKRLLSNDTVEYKAGLVEEFGDLRNIFQGQTRVKEIELLEEKIADLYLTDDQKKAILRSRINALRADIIRADVAEELENEPLGILQFGNELEKRAKPKLQALFNQILDEQKSIIENAENRKKIPLDFNDPDDKKIAESILKEAGGNRNAARELAKKKGYVL